MVAVIACVTLGNAGNLFRQGRDNQHRWEMNRGLLSVGVGLEVLVALAQAVGSLAAKPALVNGGDPMVAAAINLAVRRCAIRCSGSSGQR